MRKRSGSNGRSSSRSRNGGSNNKIDTNSWTSSRKNNNNINISYASSSEEDQNDINEKNKISKIHSNSYEDAAEKYVMNCKQFDVRVDAGVVVALKTG